MKENKYACKPSRQKGRLRCLKTLICFLFYVLLLSEKDASVTASQQASEVSKSCVKWRCFKSLNKNVCAIDCFWLVLRSAKHRVQENKPCYTRRQCFMILLITDLGCDLVMQEEFECVLLCCTQILLNSFFSCTRLTHHDLMLRCWCLKLEKIACSHWSY